jgi:hypothetical protein
VEVNIMCLAIRRLYALWLLRQVGMRARFLDQFSIPDRSIKIGVKQAPSPDCATLHPGYSPGQR